MGSPEKTGLSRCGIILKSLLVTISFLFFVLGGSLIGAAAWLRLDSTAAALIFLQGVWDGYVAVYALVMAGFVVMFAGFLGGAGAGCNSNGTLATFIFLVGSLSIMEISCGVLGALKREQVLQFFSDRAADHLLTGYGADKSATAFWDTVQSELQCCGGSGPADWLASNWFLNRTAASLSLAQPGGGAVGGFLDGLVNGNLDGILSTSSVPSSCCTGRVDPCSLLPIHLSVTSGKAYTQGCQDMLKEFAYKSVYIGIGALSGMLFLQVCSVVSAALLMTPRCARR